MTRAQVPLRAATSPAGNRKADVAYKTVRERIRSGAYGPGYRLVVDQLARETGISAIPWREAIARLEAEGWVDVVHNVGARVATFDTTAYGQTMHILARLEGYATAAAAARLTAADLVRAETINHELSDMLGDFDPVKFTALNRDFHFVLCQRCGDEHLYQLLEAEWDRLDLIRRAAFPLAPGRARASRDEHASLLELLKHPEHFDAIETAARQHKLNSLRAVYQLASPGANETAAGSGPNL